MGRGWFANNYEIDPEEDTTMTTPDIQIGDIVRVGKGTKTWVIAGFWGANNQMADLEPTRETQDGQARYSNSSADLHRLTLIHRPIPYELVDGPNAADEAIPYAVTEPCS